MQQPATEIESVIREIETAKSDIDDVVKKIKEESVKEEDCGRRAWKINEEICDVQAKLATAAHNEVEKARLLKVEQQLVSQQAILTRVWDAVRKDKDRLGDELLLLRKKEEQLRDKEKDLRADLRAEQALSGKAAADKRSQLQQLEALPTPSDMADSKKWSAPKNHAFFQCFRPTAGPVLPVALYDLVLDELVALFGAALKGVGGGDDGVGGGSSSGGGADSVPPSNEDCMMASSVCKAMAESFPNEAARMVAFSRLLNGYLGERIEPHHPICGLGYETDGSLLCRVGGPASSTWLPVYIQEVKLEIGTQGDPYFQGQRYHQLYVANSDLAAVVRHTVLPVLFVELVGPYLRVSALASPANVTVVCEPLTPYLHLFDMQRCQPDHMICVALVLRALKSGIKLLMNACGQLQPPAGPALGASSSSADGVTVPLRDPALVLPYPLRPDQGFRDVRPVEPGVYNPLYFAVYKDGPVAVKFARMSADAIRVHRAWAAAGLAPAVVSTRRLPCGLVMLVMELLAPEDGWVMFCSLPPHQKQQLDGAVVAALGLAHSIIVDRGLPGVHADLRQANVMVRLPRVEMTAGNSSGRGGGGGAAGGGGEVAVGSGMGGSDGGEDAAGRVGASSSSSSEPQVQVRFVDFDWSGLQGHTRLPAFARMRLPGYGCGCAVTQGYDRALWEHERGQGPA
ncbi:hypothetical protein HXX76_008095 [Chlamydomonas incerta]|uniref:Protein kinase domain-containing protein n=1 Tax=Chlamydomonas incerta TaxID=51695 RepID=A0A835T8X2_CHLIN|nr:hypothetical protein HXX76_008095 [Chlamydomonas incerta]|eukprot:KAG2433730.1 hypothetical protein HXX76_008095 [Chlamydomonas incerta]